MIPVNEPEFLGNEKAYLNECIDTGWVGSDGPFVKKFESEFAEYIGRKHSISVSSGTAALEVAIKALNLEKGSEVILPTMTIISCAQAITNAGLIPVPIDCSLDDYNILVDKIEEKITSNTKAIMVVHIYGITSMMDEVLEIVKKYDLKLIEDAAEVHGQEYKGKKCGSFGDISIFSFYPNKQITTGEGGMILTDDDELSEKCKSFKNLCFTRNRFVHEEIGFNYRLSNLQAAVGLAQLERIDDIIDKKRWIGETYNDLLNDQENLQLPIKKTDFCENIYWVYPVVLKEQLNKNAKEVMTILGEFKIGTRPFFYPIHKQPVYTNNGLFKDESHPNSEFLYERGFYLPSGLALKQNQIETVANKLKEIIN